MIRNETLIFFFFFFPPVVCFPAAGPVASLTLDLKSHHNQTLLDQLITSTPSWPLQSSGLASGPGDCAESYLNLLNLENSTKPDVSVSAQLEPLVTAKGKAEDGDSSCRDVIPLTLRNSANVDEKYEALFSTF